MLLFIFLSNRLNNNGFPINFLPKVVRVPCIAGSLVHSWREIPAGIPVGVAMGDLQCSVYSVEPAQGEAGEVQNESNIKQYLFAFVVIMILKMVYIRNT